VRLTEDQRHEEREASILAGGGRKYFEDFISETLSNAVTQKASLEQRGVSIVTVTGALVTIVFAVVSFALKNDHGKFIGPHTIIRGYIDWAAILFILAGFSALLTNLPLPYGVPVAGELAKDLRNPSNADSNKWDESPFMKFTEDEAAHKIAATRVALIRKAQQRNQGKATLLFIAILFEVAAIVFLALGVHRLIGL
jgi:hypothetical protein